MEAAKLVEVLSATLVPDQRQQAEQHLNEVHKIIGFCPTLLQIVLSDQIDMPIRQAGVIYLKNTATQFWEEREVEKPTDPVPFYLHKNDKDNLRENIVEAVIQSPEPIRVQLAVIISVMVKHDFPGKWPAIAEKTVVCLQSDSVVTWPGALTCLHQLIKNFEYKKKEERGALDEAMKVFLPLIHQRCLQLMTETNEGAGLVQKMILKCFYALTQFHLPLKVLTKPLFAEWMELVRLLLDRDVAPLDMDDDEKPQVVWWKIKKWAMKLLYRLFERYGSPGRVMKDYKDFSEWFIKSFSHGIIQILFNILEQHRRKIYVTPRVIQLVLNYLVEGVAHSVTWKLMKPHMLTLIQEVIFPLMCHSEADQEMWDTDPVEYIKSKYDIFEEFYSPVTASQSLLFTAVSKRKELLQKTMGFVMQVLSTEGLDARQKSGALQMVGAVADTLLKKKIYKDQVEMMLSSHVFPEFHSEHGYLRAKACWCVRQFAEVKYKNDANLRLAMDSLRVSMVTEKELPVRVEAAMALQMMLTCQCSTAKDILHPHIREVIVELLNIIRETESDDLTNVLQKFVCTYVDEISPLALDICTHLVNTFGKLVEEGGSQQCDEKAVVAMGILNTLETICTVLEEKTEVLQTIEGVILQVVGLILNHSVIDFYEELLSLVYSLTCSRISEQMWAILPLLHQMFQNDGFDYFTEMMPALHNFITVEPTQFLADQQRMEIIYSMCRAVLSNGDAGDDAECHAAKLLEVVLLQYRGQVDTVVPMFVETALERLTREIKTSELRTMCLQVVVAALYYNPALLVQILDNMRLPNQAEAVTSVFLRQWLHDTDCFLGVHDRKLCVLGLCALMDLQQRPGAVEDLAVQLVPAAAMLFDGLKRAYAAQAADENDSDDDDEEDDDGDGEELEDEEDELEDASQEYLQRLQANGDANWEEDDDEDDEYDEEFEDEADETPLESYQTPLDREECDVDEYIVFRTVLSNLQERDPEWYHKLTSQLNDKQRGEVDEIYKLAEQRRQAAESKKIEESGGYNFNTSIEIPKTFDFSSP